MAPTQRVEHAVEACPDCGTHLVGGWVQRTREVIEIPVVPVQVTEHVFVGFRLLLGFGKICPRPRIPFTFGVCDIRNILTYPKPQMLPSA